VEQRRIDRKVQTTEVSLLKQHSVVCSHALLSRALVIDSWYVQYYYNYLKAHLSRASLVSVSFWRLSLVVGFLC